MSVHASGVQADGRSVRFAIQYAADAEWPYTNKANAGIRREFFLPPDRPFNVQPARGTPPGQPT